MKFLLRTAATLALLITASTAQAAWQLATSTHFAVYVDGSEATARDAAERLEKFQIALRFLSGATAPSSPVKIRVFLVSDPNAVQDTMTFGGGSGVLGYYSATIRGPFTVMSRIDERGSRGSRGEIYVADMKAQHVLFHELTHHFSLQYFPATYPVWYSEGFAEFIGSMEFEPNDRVIVGKPVGSRYASFSDNDWLHVRKLLGAREYRDVGSSVHLLYAEGWLLVHYLTNTKARPGQLKTYLSLINKGVAFDEAARQAFGDLDKLNSELRSYSGRAGLNTLVLPFKKLDPGAISVRRLSPAEDALLPLDIRLFAGIPAAGAAEFADKVVATAGRFPADPDAFRVLFEAQRLAGRTALAKAAAERWARASRSSSMSCGFSGKCWPCLLMKSRKSSGVSAPAACFSRRSLRSDSISCTAARSSSVAPSRACFMPAKRWSSSSRPSRSLICSKASRASRDCQS